VLSGRGLCDGLIIRSEESYRLWRVVVCDQETSQARGLKPARGLWNTTPDGGCSARRKKDVNMSWAPPLGIGAKLRLYSCMHRDLFADINRPLTSFVCFVFLFFVIFLFPHFHSFPPHSYFLSFLTLFAPFPCTLITAIIQASLPVFTFFFSFFFLYFCTSLFFSLFLLLYFYLCLFFIIYLLLGLP